MPLQMFHYIIDMGSGGGEVGGRIVATGMPKDVRCIAVL